MYLEVHSAVYLYWALIMSWRTLPEAFYTSINHYAASPSNYEVDAFSRFQNIEINKSYY